MTDETKEQKTTARIFFCNSLPKNWRLNLVLQKDPEYQKLRDDWDNETDPVLKEQKSQVLREYRAKVRRERGIPEEQGE